MDIIERYKQIKAQKDTLEHSLTAEESTFKMLKSQYDEEVKKVCEEYHVSSVAEAEELLKKEEQNLQEAITKAEAVIKTLSGDDLSSEDLGI